MATPDVPRPLTPIAIDQAYEDPGAVSALVERHAPYWSIQRYVASEAELAAVSRERAADGGAPAVRVIPWFRGDWAFGDSVVEGAEIVLHNPIFIEAARQVFDAAVVRPTIVYVNLMAPMPIRGEGHIDVPAFRGFDRSEHPIWLLQSMGRSGLFRRWQIDQATAVSWFYEGEGGSFDYWASGEDAPPTRIEHLNHKAVVGDNDFMFHRVDSIGAVKTIDADMGLDTELRVGAEGQWQVAEGGTVHAEHAPGEVRVSVSWKAEVYATDEDAKIRDEHRDDLTLEQVVDVFLADLARRGTELERSARPLDDPALMAAITEAYPLPDLVYPTEKETERRRRG